jgi:dihydropteroate synthase
VEELEKRLNPRVISFTNTETLYKQMNTVGVSQKGLRKMSPKAELFVLKLENLSRIECNLIKQSALSVGGDFAVHRFILTEKVESSDGLLIGTIAQLEKLCNTLAEQPFLLPKIAELVRITILRFLKTQFLLTYPGGKLSIEKPLIMGILNVTPDSFSNGGRFLKKEDAIAQGVKLAEEGASIIDVGGESTRPGAEPVEEHEELKRVIPVIEALAIKKNLLVSIDTYKSKVARESIKAGAKIINDVSALGADPAMAEVAAEEKTPVILMHMKGTPKTMQSNPSYQDLMGEIISYLRERIKYAISSGVKEESLIIDPGIGFGKLPEHNLQILKRLEELKSLGRPILVGTSRKSFIGHYLQKAVDERIWGTAATAVISVLKGANIIRVHDVKEISEVVKMCTFIQQLS